MTRVQREVTSANKLAEGLFLGFDSYAFTIRTPGSRFILKTAGDGRLAVPAIALLDVVCPQ